MRWITSGSHLRGREAGGAFASERPMASVKRRCIVVFLLSAIAVVGWAYVLFGSGIFRIVIVDAGAISELERGEVMKEVFVALDEQGHWPWSRRNLLLLNARRLERDLKQRLFAEKVVVEKFYPNVLRLKIEKRKSSLILIAADQAYLMDRKGMAAKQLSDAEVSLILSHAAKPSATPDSDAPIVIVREFTPVAAGEPLIAERLVKRWLTAFQELAIAGFGYRQAKLDTATSTKLVLDMFEPYDVYFDLLTPMEPQIQSYYAFIKARPAGTIYSYVDARIPGRIYYR